MDAIKLLGSLMGNNATGGNLLGSLLGGATGGGGGGGKGGMGGLGALAGMFGGGAGSGSGGLGALAGMLGGGGASQAGGGAGGGLGSLLAGMGGGAASRRPEPKEENDALLLIRAMCNAAKADGQIDSAEVENIVGRLGDVDMAEAEFLEAELRAPLDLPRFVNSVPGDMAAQVYAFSVVGMKLDTQKEAQYLAAVAQGLGLDTDDANRIHSKLGAPQIFK